MKTHRRFTRVLIATLAFLAIGTAAWAGPRECGLVGSWVGIEPGDIQWLGVHTQGSTATSGMMSLDFVFINPSLLGPAARMSGGTGVWAAVGKAQYKYTWYAYGIAEDGTPLYAVRVSGLATNTDCDNVEISYLYEVFPPDDLGGDPIGSIEGSAMEMRLPLIEP